MPRRSSSGSLAVPMSMPRYSCIASALTISARPAARAERLGEVERERRLAGAGRADDRPEARRIGAGALTPRRAVSGRPSETAFGAARFGRGAGKRAGLRLRAIPRVAGAGAADAQRRAVRRVGQQVERRGVRHDDRDDVARSRQVGARGHLEVHEPVVFGAAGEPVGRGILLALAHRDEHLELAADLLLVLFVRDALLQGDQALVALLHDGLRHLVGHGRGRGALADRVLEREGAREARLLDDAHGVFEVLVGLAGEADDDVGRDRGVRHALAHAVEDAEEPLAAVRAAHRLEDRGRCPTAAACAAAA